MQHIIKVIQESNPSDFKRELADAYTRYYGYKMDVKFAHSFAYMPHTASGEQMHYYTALVIVEDTYDTLGGV